MQNGRKMNKVFIISVVIISALVLWCLVFPSNFEDTANFLFDILTGKFGWLYTVSVGAFLIFSLFLAFSRYGRIKLGDDDSKPEYSILTWFSMLFSAGTGIGLIFWGVAEPLSHYMNPIDAEPATIESAKFAIDKSFLHWTLHPWACFTVMALALAYMQFRKKESGLISRIFIPLIGKKRADGWIGKTIDILAIFATIAGVCTSLGLGTLQINSGLHYLFGIPENKVVQISIICIVTLLYMISALSGLNKGIKILSNTNIFLAFAILIIAFIVGPSIEAVNILTEGIGRYFQNIISNTFTLGAFKNKDWYGSWTIFYWAWWIAWAPFVGSFIARISKGRTIREFVAGVLLVPSLLSFIWFAVFGSMGLSLDSDVAAAAIENTSTACFIVFSKYPGTLILSGLTIILVCTFFVTSADSATFVLGIFSDDGNLNPSKKIKTVWGLLESSLALVLLIGTNDGLHMLQNMSIVGAFPFIFIMIGAMVSIVKMVKSEDVSRTVFVEEISIENASEETVDIADL